MIRRGFLAALIISVAVAASATDVYRIELKGNDQVLSKDLPKTRGTVIVFHRYPDGVLMSVKASEVRRIVAAALRPASDKSLKPGQQIMLGPSGGGAPAGAVLLPGATGSLTGEQARPGEGEPGKALFNPNRDYRPDWDSKRVPGQNIANPAGRNDYQEGRTFAYPPASAVQTQPGEPPKTPEAPK